MKPGDLLFSPGYRPEQLAYGTGGAKQGENLYTELILRAAFASMGIIDLVARKSSEGRDRVRQGPIDALTNLTNLVVPPS